MRFATCSFVLAVLALAGVGLRATVANTAVPEPAAATAAIEGETLLPPGVRYPNGIARAADGTLYVGLVTSGQVLRLSPQGTWDVFFPGSAEIYAATSLRLDERRSTLWGTSPDFLPGAQARPNRLFALNSRTGAVRRTLIVPDGGFGNDIGIAPDGTLYVTDSRKARVLRLRPEARKLEVVIEHPDLAPVNGIGAAGIALAEDGRLVVANFGQGRLVVLDGVATAAPQLRELVLPRRLENPDGIAFAPGGALLVTEGAVQSGDGKLLRIATPLAAGLQPIEVVRDRLPSPVNLTVAPDGKAFVTLSRIRHRLLPGREGEVPDRFGVLSVPTLQPPGAR